MGRVYDYATAPPASAMNTEYTPRKLERVSVWFTKQVNGATQYVNMNQKNTMVTAVPNPRTINVAPVNTRTAHPDRPWNRSYQHVLSGPGWESRT